MISTLPISTASSMRALTQLRVLSSMATFASSSNTASALQAGTGYAFDSGSLSAVRSADGFGSGSLATGAIALSNLQNVLTGLKQMASSAADSKTSASNRAALQEQYNALLSQADQLIATANANGISLKSLTQTDSVATSSAGLGLSKVSWKQASDATAGIAAADTALKEVTTVLKSFGDQNVSRAGLQKSELSALFPQDSTSADLAREIASLSGLSSTQTFQSIQNYLSNMKATLITSA